MTDPIHAAMERLIARLPASDPNGPVPAWSDSFYAACAALSADGPAVPEGREPAAVAADPTPLGPAAQAVLHAVAAQMEGEWISPDFLPYECKKLAAALRASAMRTLLTSEHYEGSTPNDYELGWNAAVAYMQNIAAELEGGTTTPTEL
jgi:hypothetical protein